MFKIIQQRDNSGMPTNKYTVECYVFDSSSHSNVKWAVFENISEKDVARYLQRDSELQQADLDWSFVVLKSGNGPVILTAEGDLMAASVKTPINIGESDGGRRVSEGNKKSLFQRKRRGGLSS